MVNRRKKELNSKIKCNRNGKLNIRSTFKFLEKKTSGTSNGWAISSKANSVYTENTRNDDNWEITQMSTVCQ